MTRKYLIVVAASAAAIALAGCASVLKDVSKCERHLDGTISGGTITPAVFAGKGNMDCCPVAGMVPNDAHTSCGWPAPKPTAASGIKTGDVVGK